MAVAATNLAALVGARDKRGAECFRRAEKLCDGAGVLRAELSALGVNETTRRAVSTTAPWRSCTATDSYRRAICSLS
jgi:hypothetical protein